MLHLGSAYAFTAIYIAKLRTKMFKTKMWPEVKELLVIGIELGSL